jgi:glutamate carboxypeptidase
VSALDQALGALRARERDILALTEALVRINSHSRHLAGVNQVGEVLQRALSPLPLELTVWPGHDTGDHLCFRSEAARSERSILLIGHHDTVFPPGVFEGFSVEGDLARGPGVLDMKGGLALVCAVLGALHDAGLLARLPLGFVSVGDEEIGSPSSRAPLEQLAQGARAALVFEAGRAGDAIITSRRGSGHAIVRARGRAAHAGNALRDGRNAIWALARFIDRAQALTVHERGISFSVGLVRGGTARNTVADEAVCEADLRFGDPEGERALIEGLQHGARAVEAELEGTHLEVDVSVTRRPWTRSEASAALCARYVACQHDSGLAGSEAPRAGGGSDANTVGAVGLPAIDGLGPRGTGFHTRDEQIEISSLIMKAEALLRFLVSELSS